MTNTKALVIGTIVVTVISAGIRLVRDNYVAEQAEHRRLELTACNQPCADVGGPGGIAGMEPVALVVDECVCAVSISVWAPLEGLDAVEVDDD
jgi:hypothetical protein